MMKSSPRHTLASLLLPLLLLVFGLDAEAQGRPLSAWQAEGSLVLIPAPARDGAGARLELPDGHALELPREPGEEHSTLTAIGPGFLITGSRLLEGEESTRRELRLLAGDRRGTYELPLPALPRDGRHRGGFGAPLFRMGAVPFVEDGELVGMAWLAGDSTRSFAVWAARWLPSEEHGKTGDRSAVHGRWGRPELVSPVGPGSQLALQAVVLRDGSWLLVWSAYDGVDNEIVFSRRRGSWEPAGRVSVDNAVPDITPALMATPSGGATVIWSRYDGESYRLTQARLEGDEWLDEGWAAPPGSLYPSLVGEPGEAYLLYRSARSRTWEAAKLASPPSPAAATEGRPEILRRGVPADPSAAGVAEDPVLIRNPNGTIELRWVGRAGAER